MKYTSAGAEFTVSKSGDHPTIQSNWYLLFGRVSFFLKAAPGTGIVSSAILQSDDLDEIDWEWLGGANYDGKVQSNYFGKGKFSDELIFFFKANASKATPRPTTAPSGPQSAPRRPQRTTTPSPGPRRPQPGSSTASPCAPCSTPTLSEGETTPRRP